jgi:hypothetical protein
MARSAQHLPQVRGAAGAALAFPLVERWDGSAWHLEPSPAGRGGSLAGVSCASANSCVAVGTTSDASSTTVALADRWNGASWTIVPTPPVPDAPFTVLSAVSCSAASACTAVVSTTAPGFGTVAERWNGSASELWNGTSWALQSSADVAGAVLTSVSCVTSSACTAVGATDNGATTAAVTGHRSPGGLAFSRGRGRTDAGSGSA